MALGDDPLQGRRYWWVNQNQTYEAEQSGGFMWSPKRNRNGARNQFYDNMAEVQGGDVVFSFRSTRIGDVGFVADQAKTSSKPEFGRVGEAWADEGWFVPVDFRPVAQPFRPKDHMDRLRQHLPEKYSPLQSDGNGLQSVYLAEIGADFARELISLADEAGTTWPDLPGIAEGDSEEAALRTDSTISETDREQLVRARRG